MRLMLCAQRKIIGNSSLPLNYEFCTTSGPSTSPVGLEGTCGRRKMVTSGLEEAHLPVRGRVEWHPDCPLLLRQVLGKKSSDVRRIVHLQGMFSDKFEYSTKNKHSLTKYLQSVWTDLNSCSTSTPKVIPSLLWNTNF